MKPDENAATFEWPVVRDMAEFERVLAAVWQFVSDIDGGAPRPRIHRTKLHDGHLLVAVEVGGRRLTIALPVGAFTELMN